MKFLKFFIIIFISLTTSVKADLNKNLVNELEKGGKLILEINFDQGNRVKELLKRKGYYVNKVIKDFGKKNRCIVSTKL